MKNAVGQKKWNKSPKEVENWAIYLLDNNRWIAYRINIGDWALVSWIEFTQNVFVFLGSNVENGKATGIVSEARFGIGLMNKWSGSAIKM
jgi:hypothetical protein